MVSPAGTFAPCLDRLLLLAPILDQHHDGRWKRKRDVLADDGDFQRISRDATKRQICQALLDVMRDEEVWLSHDAAKTLRALSELGLPFDNISVVDTSIATLMFVNGVADPAVARLKAERLAVPFDVCWIVDSWKQGVIKPMGPYAIITRSKARSANEGGLAVHNKNCSNPPDIASRQGDAKRTKINDAKSSKEDQKVAPKNKPLRGKRIDREIAFQNLMKLFDRNDDEYPWTLLNGKYVPGSERRPPVTPMKAKAQKGENTGEEVSRTRKDMGARKEEVVTPRTRNVSEEKAKVPVFKEEVVEVFVVKQEELDDFQEHRQGAEARPKAGRTAGSKRTVSETLRAPKVSKRPRRDPQAKKARRTCPIHD